MCMVIEAGVFAVMYAEQCMCHIVESMCALGVGEIGTRDTVLYCTTPRAHRQYLLCSTHEVPPACILLAQLHACGTARDGSGHRIRTRPACMEGHVGR